MTRRSNGGNERGSAAQSAPERGFGQVGRRDHMAPLLSALALSSCPRHIGFDFLCLLYESNL